MRAKDWPANRAVTSYRQFSDGSWGCTLTLTNGETFIGRDNKTSSAAFARAERIMKEKHPNTEAR